MAEIGNAFVSIMPSARGFGKSLDKQVGSGIGKSGKRAGASFGKVFAAAAAIGIGAKVGDFLKTGVTDARAFDKSMARVSAVIKSTGGVANVTAKDIEKMSGALEAKTAVDDEVIASSAQLMLTFKNVANAGSGMDAIFDRAMKSAIDLSAAGFGSVDSAAKQLGKALNDPIKGISALSRSGVTFAEQQKEQIKTLVESGKTLDAQKIIMREVESQVKGTAAAQVTAGDRAAVAWDNLRQQIGKALLPAIDRIATVLADRVIPAASKFAERVPAAFGKVTDAARPVLSALQPVHAFFKSNPAVVKAFAIGLGVVAAAMGVLTIATTAFSIALNSTGIPLVIIGLAALVAGLVLAYQRSETFRAIVQRTAEQLRIFAAWMRDVVAPAVLDLGKKVAANLQPVLTALGNVIQTRVLPMLQRAAVKFGDWWPTIQRIVVITGKLIGRWIEFGSAVYGKVLPPLIRLAGFMVSKVFPAFATGTVAISRIAPRLVAFGSAVATAAKRVTAFAKTVGQKVNEVVGFFTGLPTRIKAAFSGALGWLVDAGRNILQGLQNGLTKKWNEVEDFFGGITKKIPNLKGPPKRDKRLLTGAGVLIMQGLLDGLGKGEKGLEKTLGRVTDRIGNFLKKGFVGKKVANQMRAVVKGVVAETSKLQKLLAARRDMAAGIAGNLRGEFDLSAMTAPNEFGFAPSGGTAVKAAQAIVARMKGFAGKIARLVKSGMPAALVQEIAGMGSIDGGRVADSFLSATKAEMGQLQRSYRDFGTYAQSVGNIAAGQQYNGQIAKQQKEVRGLKQDIREAFQDMGIKIDIGRSAAAKIVATGERENKKRK